MEDGMSSPQNVSADHLRELSLSRRDRGSKPGTIANRRRSLRAYYKRPMGGGERPGNPLSRVPAPKVPDQIMPHYSPEMITALLASVNANPDAPALRDPAIILTLCGCQSVIHTGGNMAHNRNGAIKLVGDVLGVPVRAGASRREPLWRER